MNEQTATYITSLPVNEGIEYLELIGASLNDDVYEIDGYAFFQAFEDSKHLCYEF